MKLVEIKKDADLESVARKVLAAFRDHKLGRDVRSGDFDQPEKQGNSYEFGMRYWGEWEIPEDEDEDEEDYDWKVPTKASTKAADELRKKLETEHGVKIQLSGGEKEWTYVTVSKG